MNSTIFWIIIILIIISTPFVIHKLCVTKVSFVNIKDYLIPTLILLTDFWVINSVDFIIDFFWLWRVEWEPITWCCIDSDWVLLIIIFIISLLIREIILIKQKNIKYFIFSNLWILLICYMFLIFN